MKKKYQWLYLAMVLFTLATQEVWRDYRGNELPFVYDVDQYYSYCIGAFVKNDMRTDGVLASHNYWMTQLPNGKSVRKYTCGMAVMYSPFFLAAHFYTQLIGFNSSGYTGTYAFFITLGTFFYVFFGFFFLRRSLLRFYSEKITAWVIFSLFMCTNLFYYTVGAGEMSHSYLFAIYGLYIYSVIQWQETSSQKYLNLIMFCLGMVTLIRPTEILSVLFFLLYSIHNKATLIKRITLLKENIIPLLYSFIFFVLPLIPQLLYWKIYGGQWIIYSYGEERFFFNDPKIIEVLLSYRNGLLVYSPILLFAFIGFFFLYKENRSLFFSIFLLSVIALYVVASWWCWWYVGFGLRAYIQYFAFLAFPLAAFYESIHSAINKVKVLFVKKYLIPFVLVFFCLNNLIRHFQFKANIIHWDAMSKEAFWFSVQRFNYTQEDREYLESVYIHPDSEKALMGKRDYVQ